MAISLAVSRQARNSPDTFFFPSFLKPLLQFLHEPCLPSPRSPRPRSASQRRRGPRGAPRRRDRQPGSPRRPKHRYHGAARTGQARTAPAAGHHRGGEGVGRMRPGTAEGAAGRRRRPRAYPDPLRPVRQRVPPGRASPHTLAPSPTPAAPAGAVGPPGAPLDPGEGPPEAA